MTKYGFYGTLPNGSKGLVVVLECVDMQAAYRILKRHANLESFRPVR